MVPFVRQKPEPPPQPARRRAVSSAPSRRDIRRLVRKHGAGSSHPSTERWLLTYADMITLLLIFFVILFAMSKINEAKFEALSKTLTVSLHGHAGLLPNQTTIETPVTIKPPVRQTDQNLDPLYDKIKAYIEQHHLGDKVTVTDDTRGVEITFRDVALFSTGDATLRPDAKSLLSGLSPFFSSIPNQILVEGYTDDVPISTDKYESNWDLSAARAIHVVNFLMVSHISPDRLSAVGYGPYHPVVPNTSDTNRQKNRRVNIVILRK